MMSIGSCCCFSFADKLEFHNLLLSTRHSSSLASSSSSSSRTRVLRSRVLVDSRGRRARGNDVHVALNCCCSCIGLRELAWKEGKRGRRFVVAASSSRKSSARKEEGEEGGGDGIMDEALRATIEKSKKVMEMQDDLLKQIAERKELVSSIKKNILNPKRDSSASSDFNISFTSLNMSESDDSAEEKYRSESSAENSEEPSHTPDMASGRSDDFSGEGLEQYISTQPHPIQQELSELWNYSTSEYSADKLLQQQSFSERNNSGEPLVERSEPVKHANMLTQEPASAFTFSDAGISNPKSSTNEVEPTRNESQVFTGDESINASPPAGANVMNVILVAAECAPWSKTGGLGDVAGSLPKALARRGHRVMVIAPKYGDYHEAQNTGVRKRYNVAGQDIEVGYFQAYIDGVDFVFIDNNLFHHNARDIYGGDRMEIKKRMILLCKAAVEVPWHVPCGGVCYGDGNLVFIANDWHTALLPVYLKAYYRDNGLMKYTRSVLVIHNLAHQGRGPVDDFLLTGLPEHYLERFFMDDPVGGEHSNIFAAGLKCADRIVTVSHGYAWELKTQEGGWGLHNVIKENDWKLRGIVNGIDKNEWHPTNDVNLQSDGYTNYSIETLKTGKRQCKEALQREMGLPVRPDTPLIGFIGRLDYQKGVDLISEAIPWMMGQDLQLCMLGTGRPDLENMLRQIEGQYRDKVRAWVGFSVKTAHRITAGADILLMPSRFEPCGLNQLYAMAYGTIPVVHAVGGLRDTVQQFNPFDESGLGWTFERADAHHLTQALMNCLRTCRDHKDSWEGLQRRGMMQDLSWDHAAEIYEEVLVAAKYQW